MATKQLFLLMKWCLISSGLMLTVMLLFVQEQPRRIPRRYVDLDKSMIKDWQHFTYDQKSTFSELGRYLYLAEPPKIQEPNKKYTILIWKYGPTLERRHIKHFSDQIHDPFEMCSVKNCRITYEEKELNSSDAVLFHLQRLKGLKDLPEETSPRPENQTWVFLTDETPFHTFLTPGVKLTDFNGRFNWSMTYRMDSDVPVPYGRTVLMSENEIYEGVEFKKSSDVLVAIMGSNCGGKNHRWEYVKELQKHINVDIFGRCGPLKCAGHFDSDCDILQYYKFYLSFENSNCDQYITEKLWWNAYSKNAIPIVMGAKQQDYTQLLPPKSYINIEDFASPADLARYITYVNKTIDIYRSYFDWKKYYRISNEHGYFKSQSYHYCRLCEALNYNSREKKVYDKLEEFWSLKNCYKSWDES